MLRGALIDRILVSLTGGSRLCWPNRVIYSVTLDPSFFIEFLERKIVMVDILAYVPKTKNEAVQYLIQNHFLGASEALASAEIQTRLIRPFNKFKAVIRDRKMAMWRAFAKCKAPPELIQAVADLTEKDEESYNNFRQILLIICERSLARYPGIKVEPTATECEELKNYDINIKGEKTRLEAIRKGDRKKTNAAKGETTTVKELIEYVKGDKGLAPHGKTIRNWLTDAGVKPVTKSLGSRGNTYNKIEAEQALKHKRRS